MRDGDASMLMSLYQRDMFLKKHGFSVQEMNALPMAEITTYEAMIVSELVEQSKQKN